MAGEFAVATPKRAYVYRELSGSQARLLKALALAQGRFKKVVKNQTGQYGPFADLVSMRDATVDALADNGLSVTQEYAMQDGELVLVTTLGHDSGEWISSVLPIKQAPSPQATMGFMTYMRRAAYAALLCLAAEEDDDGKTAEDAAAASRMEGEASLHKRAAAAIAAAPTKDALDQLMKRVEQQVAANKMSRDSLDRLRVLAVEALTRLTEGQK